MNWHEFIFSEKPAHRIRRHIIFWLLWWIYFATTYYYYLQVGLKKIAFGNLGSILLVKSFPLILIQIAACYFFIYILLPRYLLTKKYFLLTAGILFLAAFLLTGGYFIQHDIFPFIDATYHYKISEVNNTLWWTNINSGLLTAPKVIAAATIIKLAKRWYLKQKEKERLEKEKLITDLKLMKAQIRPGFLFSSLDQIYKCAKKKSPEAPELLLKLADLLSYLLYECDEPKVPLEKELNMMKEYMALEKVRYGSRLELETVIKGEVRKRQIAPLLLLPFIENSFKHCSNVATQPWINLQISLDNETLLMKLINGVAFGYEEPCNSVPEVMNIEKRLQLLYPGKYELKRYVENEIYIVLLKINLGEGSRPEYPASKSINGHKFKTAYAIR
jgi:two-component system, LytTR family, sensor kinase